MKRLGLIKISEDIINKFWLKPIDLFFSKRAKARSY